MQTEPDVVAPHCISALGQTRDSGAADALIALLSTKNYEDVGNAAKALMETQDSRIDSA